jgi:hypothetical protein
MFLIILVFDFEEAKIRKREVAASPIFTRHRYCCQQMPDCRQAHNQLTTTHLNKKHANIKTQQHKENTNQQLIINY